jgi:hypothetical protein
MTSMNSRSNSTLHSISHVQDSIFCLQNTTKEIKNEIATANDVLNERLDALHVNLGPMIQGAVRCALQNALSNDPRTSKFRTLNQYKSGHEEVTFPNESQNPSRKALKRLPIFQSISESSPPSICLASNHHDSNKVYHFPRAFTTH